MCSKINYSFASALCRTVCMLLALLTVGSLCFLPGNVGEASAATKKVTIPDPAEYFGKVVDTDSGASYIAYYFDGYSSFPESKIDSYVKALKNVGLTAVSTSNGGNIINLNYDGDFGVQISWSKQSKHIRVNVVQPLTISSSTSTTTTTTTTATTTTTEKKATIPSPGDYFGGVDKTNPGNKWTVYYCNGHSSYPKSAMESYIKALKNAGLTGGTVSKQSNGDMLAKLNYNGVHVVSVRWYKKDKYVWVNISDSISIAAATGHGTVVTPTKPSSSDPSILDMIEEIFGKHWKVDYYDDNTYSYLYFKVSSYPTQKMNQFAKELKDLGLKEVVKYDHGDDGKCIEYQWNKEECVKIWYYPHEEKDDSFNIGVDWVVLKKTGVFDESDIPAKPAPAPQPGPDDREPCSWCGGDGKCRDCGGSGSVTKWVSGTVRSYVTQNCTSCYSPGKCRDCGGDGWK